MAEKYKFIYFRVRGRGEFIRYILLHGEFPYEEQLIEAEEWWSTEKERMPFGALPVLEVNGKLLAQSTSIGRFLAEKCGLAGSSEWSKAYADMLVRAIEDIQGNYYIYAMAVHRGDEKAIGEALNVLLNETLTPLFKRFENMLGNKKYFVDEKLTWADLAIAELSDRITRCFEKNFMDSYPCVKRHMIDIHELPKIKKHVETRSSYKM